MWLGLNSSIEAHFRLSAKTMKRGTEAKIQTLRELKTGHHGKLRKTKGLDLNAEWNNIWKSSLLWSEGRCDLVLRKETVNLHFISTQTPAIPATSCSSIFTACDYCCFGPTWMRYLVLKICLKGR